MVLPQRVTAEETFHLVPPILAAAASAYQHARVVEHDQLAVMGRCDLSEPWSDEVQATVLLARRRIHETQAARAHFRDQVRAFVVTLRVAGEAASATLRHTRSMIQLLQSSGALATDGGRVEAEILAWAIEDYESR
jgi:hypothetical protein